jgi:signal transduction histidine kinase
MDQEKLHSLAAAEQLNFNSRRYEKVHDAFTTRGLTEEEIERLTRLYQSLLAADLVDGFAGYWVQVELSQIRHDVKELGSGVIERNERTQKAMHDLRGGSLFVLTSLTIEEIESFFEFPEFRSFAREQAKLMRGMIPFLDPERARLEEETVQVHTVSKLLEGWRNRLLVRDRKPIRVEVVNDFEGAITCRCVETSAFDRVLVNLTNNAARFAPVKSSVELVAFQASEQLCRICVLNRIDNEQKKWLLEKLEDNGVQLFQVGVTRGSTGLGLGSTADVLSQVFGIFDTDRLVRAGYLGTALVEDRFCAWFHWPLYLPSPEDSLCNCPS